MYDRMIRHGIVNSDRVNSLSWAAEVFYRRLQSLVDDFGNCDGRLNIIRGELYKLKLNQVSEPDIAKWLEDCESAGLISFYEVERKVYVHLHGFQQRKKFLKADVPKAPPDLEEKRREVEDEGEEKRSPAPSYAKSNLAPSVKNLLPIEVLQEKFFADVQWIEVAGMKISKTGDEVKKLVGEFVIHLKSQKIVSKEEKDFITHFFNWVGKKGFNNKNNGSTRAEKLRNW